MKQRLKKSLSMLLSIMMIVTSISVGFVMQASAVTVNDVADAFNRIPAGEEAYNVGWTSSAPHANNATGTLAINVVDKTSNSSIYDAALAVGSYMRDNVVIGDPGDEKTTDIYRMSWWTKVNAELEKKVAPKYHNLLRVLTDMSTDAQGTAKRGRFTEFCRDSKDLLMIAGPTGVPSVTINVTITDYQALVKGAFNSSNIPASLKTKVSYTATTTRTSYSYKTALIGSKTAYYLYFSAKPTVTETTSTALTNNINDYKSYFDVKLNAISTQHPHNLDVATYNTWKAEINTTNGGKRNLINTIPADRRAFYIPKYQQYLDWLSVFDSREAMGTYNNDINYFQNPTTGFNAKITPTKTYDPQNYAAMLALWNEQAPAAKRLNDLPQVMKDTLTTSPYATPYNLNLAAINNARAILQNDIQLYELPALKDEIDILVSSLQVAGLDYSNQETYPEFWLNSAYNQVLAKKIQLNKYLQANIDVIFPDGAAAFNALYNALKYEFDYRGLVITQDELVIYYSNLKNDDYTDVSSADIINRTRTAVQRLTEIENTLVVAQALLTPEHFNVLYGGLLAQANDAIAFTKDLLAKRFEYQVGLAYSSYLMSGVGKVDWQNFTLVKSFINLIEKEIYDYLVTETNSGVINATAISNYLALKSSIIDQFNAFIQDGGFSTYANNIIDLSSQYPVRDDFVSDLARMLDPDYKVTEADLLNVISSLDKILTSTEFVGLTGMDLAACIPGITACMCSDNMVNCIVQIVYPAILDAFEDAWAGLPTEYAVNEKLACAGLDIRIKADLPINVVPLHNVLASTAAGNTINQLAVYPDLLAKALPNTADFAAARAGLNAAVAGITDWTVKDTLDANGNDLEVRTGAWEGTEEINWNVDNPVAGSSMAAMTKSERFRYAMSNALTGVFPLLGALLMGQNYKGHGNVAASMPQTTLRASSGFLGFFTPVNIDGKTIQVNQVFLDLTATPNQGYSKVFAPIFEMLLGENPPANLIPTPAQLQGFTTANQLIDAIVLPINAFLNQLAAAPVSKLTELLPNIAYAMSFDKVAPLLNELFVGIAYDADAEASDMTTNLCSLVQGQVAPLSKIAGDSLKGSVDVNVGKLLLGDPESAPIDLTMMTDFSGFIQKLPACIGGGDCNIALPVMDGSCLARLGTMTTTLPTNRVAGTSVDPVAACGATRHYIRADKADVMFSILKYLVNGFSTSPELMSSFSCLLGGSAPSTPGTSACAICQNITDPDNASNVIAAIVELFNQNKYTMPEYTWAAPTTGAMPYLKYSNNWTYAKADYLYQNLDSLVAKILTLTGQEGTVQDLINDALADVFTDDTLKSITDALAGLDLDDTIKGLVTSLGIDMDAWAKYNALYDANNDGVIDAADEILCDLNEDGIFDDADQDLFYYYQLDTTKTPVEIRQEFLGYVYEILDTLSPVLAFVLNGSNISIMNNGLNFLGADGYANAIVPILEMLNCENIMTADAYKAAIAGGNTEVTISAVIDPLFAKIEDLIANPVSTIIDVLPNLLYFLYSDSLSVTLERLLNPLFAILDTVRPIYPLGLDMIVEMIPEETRDKFNLNFTSISELNFDFFTKFIDDASGLYVGPALTVVCEDLLNYVTQVPFANNTNGYKVTGIRGGDTVTIIFSFLLELLAIPQNQEKIAEMAKLDTAILPAIYSILKSEAAEVIDLNWFYFDDQIDPDDPFFVPTEVKTPDPRRSLVYLTYPNNWTVGTANYINDNLDAILADVLSLVEPDGGDISDIINGTKTLDELLGDVLYNDDLFNEIVDLIKGLLEDFDTEIVAGIAADLDYLLETDLAFLVNHDGNWGVTDRATFISAFASVLNVIEPLVDWLLAGKDLAFFHNSEITGTPEGEDLINIAGSNGYANAIVPLLEALGVRGLISSSDFVGASMEDKVAGILNPVFDRLEAVIADPVNEVIKMIPNLIYFINANGLTVVVNNLLGGVLNIVEAVAPALEFDLQETLKGFPLDNITFESLLTFASSMIKFGDNDATLDFTPIINLLDKFWLGDISYFESANGSIAYRMDYMDYELNDVRYHEHFGDVLTIVVSALFQMLDYDNNADAFKDILGEDVYALIKNILNMDQYTINVQSINWLFTDRADQPNLPAISPIDNSTEFPSAYGKLWTRAKAKTIADNFPKFIDNIVHLVGIEIEGFDIDNINELIETLVGTSVYTSKNITSILDMLLDLIDQVDEIQGSAHIKFLLKESLGVDLDYWKNNRAAIDAKIAAIADGDSESFVVALNEILKPVEPILEWLLMDGSYSFFVDENQNDYVILQGGQGYEFGLIPILEALHCEDIKTLDELKNDPGNMIANIVRPLLNKVDEILANPVDEVMGILPAIFYFINSDGLTASVHNILDPLYILLDAVEPLVKVDLAETLGFDLNNITFDSIFGLLNDILIKETGYDFKELAVDDIAELTIGRVRSFPSKNGETAYTMDYASEEQMTDMVTIILRLGMKFIALEDNAIKLKQLLADPELGIEAPVYKNLCAIIDTLIGFAGSVEGYDIILGTLYEVAYAAFIAIQEVTDVYDDISFNWNFIFKLLQTSDSTALKNIYSKILEWFGTGNNGDIADPTEVAPNGFIKFFTELFAKISAFFQSIIDFFNNLFK